MSDRLHIGATDDQVYDCVLDSLDGAKDKLIEEWATGWPLKVRIGDMALFLAVQPVIVEVFDELGRNWPDDVWHFYYKQDSMLDHPTQAELDAWCAVHNTSGDA